MKSVPIIVLSGGPSGGKSKALRALSEELEKLGLDVICVTEAAQSVLGGGFDRSRPVYEFQKAIALLQLETEKSAKERAGESSVIICDRGLMDCRVYLDDGDFERLKSELDLTEVDLRDRYDAVFHLDSTSSTDDTKYRTNELRVESRLEASEINERSLRAWCGNPHYRFIPVKETFEEKFAILLREVKAFLGIPKPLEIERKYLIKYPDLDCLSTLVCSKSHIFQTYLLGENGRYRLRKRGENGKNIFIKTVKSKISETVREEVETRLTEEEYEALLKEGAVIGSIEKDRYCLMYGGVYYEIDVFPFWKHQAYIEVELLSENDSVVLPEFIELIREVTYDSRYKNSSLCRSVPAEEI